MNSEDDIEISLEDKKLLESLKGYDFTYRDLSFAIFENKTTFPHSIAFLIKIPLQNTEAGVIIVTNPQRGTYSQRACKNRKILDRAYKLSKEKILSRGEVYLGWEGACLLDGFEKLN